MPKISEMIPSKYLRKEEVDQPVLFTIADIKQETVGQGDEQEEKWIMYFREAEKGMVLNSTNMRLLEMITGSDDSDNWMGRQVVAYNDPNISFGGKLTGGIRLRAPKSAHKTAAVKRGDPPPGAPLPPEAHADVPF
jgi:hypothetical protein